MIRQVITSALAGILATAPCSAAELIEVNASATARTGALAGAYVRLPLGRTSEPERSLRAGFQLAFTRSSGDVRSFATRREASLLDYRLVSASSPALFVAGLPVAGRVPDRLNAEGESKGRLDKIMIGAGVALGAVAAFFLVSSTVG